MGLKEDVVPPRLCQVVSALLWYWPQGYPQGIYLWLQLPDMGRLCLFLLKYEYLTCVHHLALWLGFKFFCSKRCWYDHKLPRFWYAVLYMTIHPTKLGVTKDQREPHFLSPLEEWSFSVSPTKGKEPNYKTLLWFIDQIRGSRGEYPGTVQISRITHCSSMMRCGIQSFHMAVGILQSLPVQCSAPLLNWGNRGTSTCIWLVYFP